MRSMSLSFIVALVSLLLNQSFFSFIRSVVKPVVVSIRILFFDFRSFIWDLFVTSTFEIVFIRFNVIFGSTLLNYLIVYVLTSAHMSYFKGPYAIYMPEVSKVPFRNNLLSPWEI